MTTLHRVGLVGFGAFERSTFDLFFRTSALRAGRPPAAITINPVREHGYVLVAPQDSPALVLINGDLRLAARQAWRWPGRCISVGEQSFTGAIVHLQRPVPMGRLLGVLDDLVQRAAASAASEPASLPGIDGNAAGAGAASPQGRSRLLVVDDNPRTRRAISRYFLTLGVEANFAGSGEEALYRVSQRPYELVLLDTHLGGISGWLTCRLIKTRPYPDLQRAPRVLMMARREGPLDSWRVLRSRCDGRLLKPLQKHELLEAVKPFM
jgi:CheY-like chemotaxis protein